MALNESLLKRPVHPGMVSSRSRGFRLPQCRRSTNVPARLLLICGNPFSLSGGEEKAAKPECDTGLQFAEFRDKKEVKEAIHAWLTNPDHPDDQVAQNLYIGSHGNKLGLFPTTRSKRSEVLTWAELASVINPPKRPIVLWLGACESSYAAEAWSQPGMNVPVQLIVGFSGEPDDHAVTALLLQLVHMSNIKTRGRKPRRKPLTYLPADVRRLRRMKFKKSVVTVHYKFEDRPQPEYVEVSKFRSRVKMGFGKYLDKKNIPVPKLFDEALNSLCGSLVQRPK